MLEVADDCVAAEPGQFYMLMGVDGWGGGDAQRPFVGRAISALRATGDGRISFLIEAVGPGTGQLTASERLWLVGPLGRGFTPPEGGRELLLVGGGVGIPPLVMAQEAWGGRALVGFRDAHHAQAASLFKDPEIATDDGSAGHHGFVTDLLDRVLEGRADVVIYACGPRAMLEAVRQRAGRHRVKAQLGIEAEMACGFGSCWGCVVATKDGYKRVCVDGPVFDAAVLA
ncbi:MAG: dihydroorotate dehydrogenase electron transfer subunit [Solirubrobacteraceae bacterium]